MTALLGVIVAKAGDRAPSPTQVLVILVWNGADARAKVKRDRSERRVREGASEGRIVLLQPREGRSAKR